MRTFPHVEDPEFFLSHSADVSTPRLVRRSVESLFASTGEEAFPPPTVFRYASYLAALLGLYFGYDNSGRLYGPLGALIGTCFGYGLARIVSGVFAALVWRRLSRTQRMARATDAGDYRRALAAAETLFRRQTEAGRAGSRAGVGAAAGSVRDFLLAENYRGGYAVTAANLLGAAGLFHEALGEPDAALSRYSRALAFSADHAYVLYAALGLLERYPGLALDRGVLLEALRVVQRRRHSFGRFLLMLYRDELARRFPDGEFSSASPVPAAWSPPPGLAAPTGNGRYFLRLLPGLGHPSPGGLLVLEAETVGVLRLTPPVFAFTRYLGAAALLDARLPGRPPAERGWISTRELLANLPNLPPDADAETIANLAEQLRRQILAGFGRDGVLEQNAAGYYRLAAEEFDVVLDEAPDKIRPL